MSFCLALALMSLACVLTQTTTHPHIPYEHEEKTEVLQISSPLRSLVDRLKHQEPALEINLFNENEDPEELSSHRHRRSPQDFDDDVEDSPGNRGKGNKGKGKGKDKKKDKCNNGNGRGNGHGRCKKNKKTKELTPNNDTNNESTPEAKDLTADLKEYVSGDKIGLWAERRRRSDKGNSGGANGGTLGQENNYLTKKKSFDQEQILHKVEFDDSQREAEEDALDQISLALSRNKRSVFDDDDNILENPDSDFEDKRGFGARVKCFGGIGSWGVVSYGPPVVSRPPVVVGTPIGGGGGVIGGGGAGGGGGGTGGGGGGTIGGGEANLGGQYRSAQYRTGGRGRSGYSRSRGRSNGYSYQRRQPYYRQQVVYVQQPVYVEQPVYVDQPVYYGNQQPVYSNQQQSYGYQQQGYAASHGRTNPDAEVIGSYRSG